jgi:hypothetical protein
LIQEFPEPLTLVQRVGHATPEWRARTEKLARLAPLNWVVPDKPTRKPADPGMAARKRRRRKREGADILALFSRLSRAEQGLFAEVLRNREKKSKKGGSLIAFRRFSTSFSAHPILMQPVVQATVEKDLLTPLRTLSKNTHRIE